MRWTSRLKERRSSLTVWITRGYNKKSWRMFKKTTSSIPLSELCLYLRWVTTSPTWKIRLNLSRNCLKERNLMLLSLKDSMLDSHLAQLRKLKILRNSFGARTKSRCSLIWTTGTNPIRRIQIIRRPNVPDWRLKISNYKHSGKSWCPTLLSKNWGSLMSRIWMREIW